MGARGGVKVRSPLVRDNWNMVVAVDCNCPNVQRTLMTDWIENDNKIITEMKG